MRAVLIIGVIALATSVYAQEIVQLQPGVGIDVVPLPQPIPNDETDTIDNGPAAGPIPETFQSQPPLTNHPMAPEQPVMPTDPMMIGNVATEVVTDPLTGGQLTTDPNGVQTTDSGNVIAVIDENGNPVLVNPNNVDEAMPEGEDVPVDRAGDDDRRGRGRGGRGDHGGRGDGHRGGRGRGDRGDFWPPFGGNPFNSCFNIRCQQGWECEMRTPRNCFGRRCFPTPTCVPGNFFPPQPPQGSCATVRCSPGTFCQMQSTCQFGRCTSRPVCLPTGNSPSSGCDSVRCRQGTICRVVQVNCFVPPCNPVPECVNPCQGALCPRGTVCRVAPWVPSQAACFAGSFDSPFARAAGEEGQQTQTEEKKETEGAESVTPTFIGNSKN